MKLTPGVDFTNILIAAFTQAEPKRAKTTAHIFVLGSVSVKASHKMSVKWTPGHIFYLRKKDLISHLAIYRGLTLQ